MPIYKIVQKETYSSYTYIDAENEEEAKEMANNIESHSWRDCQDYNSEYSSIIIPDETELVGRIIESYTGYYNYPKNIN